MDHHNILDQAYDPETFRRQGYALIDQMAEILASRNGERPAIHYRDPADALHSWELDLENNRGGAPLDLWKRTLNEGVQLHNPRYMGHQISPPAPITALAGLVNDFMNNGMGVYEMGVDGVSLERLVCKLVAGHMGFSEKADGILTSGGTLANMTALLTARSVKASEKVWTEGSKKQLALMVSEEAHYCVDRAVRIMGWGEAGIIKIPCDQEFRMRTELLDAYYQKAIAEGTQVIAVVGSACSTATGSFDNLNALADFCEKYDLWLHIDGAHGAATVFSEKYRHLVDGLQRADSVAMDFHKMLMTPAIATALIYRDGQNAYRTFAQKAAYLWDNQNQDEGEWYNLARRTFECTKAMYSLKFYSLYRTYGPQLLEAYVTRVIDTTQRFGAIIGEANDFELAVDPACNIICFRFAPPGLPNLNTLNAELRRQLLEEGHFYIVQTKLRDQVYLRCTLTNPFTTEKEIRALLAEIEARAKAFVGSA